MTLKASMEAAKDVLLWSKLGGGRNNRRFTYLGSGCYRSAWLDQDHNVVYKIDSYAGQRGGNKDEVVNLVDSTDSLPLVLPDGRNARLPEWDAFKIGDEYVVAMEYCPEACHLWGDSANLIEAWFGLTDVGHENCRESADGDVVVTDLGLRSSQREALKHRQRHEHDCTYCSHVVAPPEEPSIKEYAWDAAS